MLEAFAFIVLLVLIAAVIAIIIVIGNIPGNIARKSGHPQADAITTLAWIGLITGIGWFLALVWAKTKPCTSPAILEQRIAALERAQETQQ
ncbi:MAG: hypothetical protein ACI9DQ_001249 [Glaciecola sp.]|jgi:hypothetical protein